MWFSKKKQSPPWYSNYVDFPPVDQISIVLPYSSTKIVTINKDGIVSIYENAACHSWFLNRELIRIDTSALQLLERKEK